MKKILFALFISVGFFTSHVSWSRPYEFYELALCLSHIQPHMRLPHQRIVRVFPAWDDTAEIIIQSERSDSPQVRLTPLATCHGQICDGRPETAIQLAREILRRAIRSVYAWNINRHEDVSQKLERWAAVMSAAQSCYGILTPHCGEETSLIQDLERLIFRTGEVEANLSSLLP